MAVYDVFRLPGTTDLLLDVQITFLNHLSTRVAAPLVRKTPFLKPAPRLNPIFLLEEHQYVLMTHFITSVPARDLHHKVTNLEHEQYTIKSALDMLFYGF